MPRRSSGIAGPFRERRAMAENRSGGFGNFRRGSPSYHQASTFPVTLSDYNTAVDAHADGIYRFAVKHLRDTETAKDVVQESFARLWQKLEEVDGTKAKSYLFTTAHHLLVDEVRKGSRSTRMEERYEDREWTGQAQPDLPTLARM